MSETRAPYWPDIQDRVQSPNPNNIPNRPNTAPARETTKRILENDAAFRKEKGMEPHQGDKKYNRVHFDPADS